MAWLESHQSLGEHPKTRKAARLLGVGLPQMVGHLHFLWWWALDYAEDGDLSRFSDEDIELAARWDGESGVFAAALSACSFGDGAGFIDLRSGKPIIHDWWDYAGKLIEKRRTDAERKRAGRSTSAPAPTATNQEDVASSSNGRPQDIHRTAQVNQPTNQPTVTEPTNQPTNDAGADAPIDRSLAKPVRDPPGFSAFWSAYPNKVRRKQAVTLWQKIKPNAETQQRILDAVSAQKQGDRWIRGYVPDPNRWLSEQRWEDEIPPPPIRQSPNGKEDVGPIDSTKYQGDNYLRVPGRRSA